MLISTLNIIIPVSFVAINKEDNFDYPNSIFDALNLIF